MHPFKAAPPVQQKFSDIEADAGTDDRENRRPVSDSCG